jgi:hypothetical protein
MVNKKNILNEKISEDVTDFTNFHDYKQGLSRGREGTFGGEYYSHQKKYRATENNGFFVYQNVDSVSIKNIKLNGSQGAAEFFKTMCYGRGMYTMLDFDDAKRAVGGDAIVKYYCKKGGLNNFIVDDDKVKEWKAADSSKRKKIDINKFVTYYSQYKKKPKWKTNTYYNQESKSVAPEFRTNYYYSYSSREVAPQFATNTYYSRKTVVTAPSFVTNRYYSRAIVDVYESFKSNAIYRQSEDRYATLVEDGIKKLQSAFAEKDSARVKLEELQSYDVNDIVGARENVTGLVVKHYITKKIIDIENGKIKIDYIIGKE